MSTHSPFGVPAGRNSIAPGYQPATIPEKGGGFASELTSAQTTQPAKGQTPVQPTAGLLVVAGAAAIVPPTELRELAPLQVVYENLSPAKKEQYESTFLAMFPAGNE